MYLKKISRDMSLCEICSPHAVHPDQRHDALIDKGSSSSACPQGLRGSGLRTLRKHYGYAKHQQVFHLHYTVTQASTIAPDRFTEGD